MATKMKTLTINDVTYDITDDSAVSFVEEQNLTDEQKAQARENIGAGEANILEPAEDDIPKVFINGAIPPIKTEMLAEMKYVSKTESFDAYLLIKAQGNSSISYPKKNFTIKMYSDETRETKLKKTFKDWGYESHKYVLKANYVDHTHARNIVCANLWSQTIESRTDYNSLPVEMRNSPRNGAIDGFPVKVYTNGTYQGIYTWNIGKDDWMWGMDEDNTNHILLCAEHNTDNGSNPCFFDGLWDGSDAYWSVEVGTYTDAVKNSLNALISCVKDTDDATFKSTIGNYLDVQSAIDYAIHQNVILGIDNAAKNMLLATYDGVKWYCGAYDMDLVLGLTLESGSNVVASYDHYKAWWGWTSNRLFSRIKSVFKDEVIQRNKELRNTVYSKQNMIAMFEKFSDVIGTDLYDEDLEVYPNISTIRGGIKHVREFIKEREWYADREIETPLYSLVDGSGAFSDGYTYSVTNGAEICVRVPNDAYTTSVAATNISNVTQNTSDRVGDNQWHRPEIFKLYTGDEVRIVLEIDNTKITDMPDERRYDSRFIGDLRLNGSDTDIKYKWQRLIETSTLGYGAPYYDHTIIMDTDLSVGSISVHMNYSTWFKFKIYVNGVRYV